MRIGINGFGRIGRAVLRRALRTDLEIVAINDITEAAALAHLLRHDSTYGALDLPVAASTDALTVNGTSIAISAHADPAAIDWRAQGVELVIDATGRFRTRDALAGHLKAGARRVLLSAPGKGLDVTIVPGVNDAAYDPGPARDRLTGLVHHQLRRSHGQGASPELRPGARVHDHHPRLHR